MKEMETFDWSILLVDHRHGSIVSINTRMSDLFISSLITWPKKEGMDFSHDFLSSPWRHRRWLEERDVMADIAGSRLDIRHMSVSIWRIRRGGSWVYLAGSWVEATPNLLLFWQIYEKMKQYYAHTISFSFIWIKWVSELWFMTFKLWPMKPH